MGPLPTSIDHSLGIPIIVKSKRRLVIEGRRENVRLQDDSYIRDRKGQ